MIDYGLFALIVVVLTLIFLAFHAWRGIKAEGDRISAQAKQVDSKVLELQAAIQQAKTDSEEAKRIALEVQGTHYKSLLRRIDESEASTLGHQKQVEVLAEKIASLGGRMSAFQRHFKREEPAEDEVQQMTFPAAQMPPPGNVPVTGHFGRFAARKVG